MPNVEQCRGNKAVQLSIELSSCTMKEGTKSMDVLLQGGLSSCIS